MSAVLSCTRFTPRRAANEATAGEILHQWTDFADRPLLLDCSESSAVCRATTLGHRRGLHYSSQVWYVTNALSQNSCILWQAWLLKKPQVTYNWSKLRTIIFYTVLSNIYHGKFVKFVPLVAFTISALHGLATFTMHFLNWSFPVLTVIEQTDRQTQCVIRPTRWKTAYSLILVKRTSVDVIATELYTSDCQLPVPLIWASLITAADDLMHWSLPAVIRIETSTWSERERERERDVSAVLWDDVDKRKDFSHTQTPSYGWN